MIMGNITTRMVPAISGMAIFQLKRRSYVSTPVIAC
jgi:hypothetical protein